MTLGTIKGKAEQQYFFDKYQKISSAQLA